MNRLLRRRWVIATLLVLGALILGYIFGFRSYSDPAVVVVSAPNRLPAPKEPWLNRVVPYSWGWFWRMKQAVFGSPRAVNLEAKIFSFATTEELNRSKLDLNEPTYVATNGIQVWVLAEADLQRLSGACWKIQDAKALGQPRINTADAIGASLFCGEAFVLGGVTNSVGVSFDCYPRVHREMTELTTTLLVSEALTNGVNVTVRTNVDVTARVKLQRGTGFFLLDNRAHQPDGKAMGVLVFAKVPKK